MRGFKQKWRFKNWAEGVFSTVRIELREPEHGTTVLSLTQTGVPLADCFGNQWGELGMTAAEYEEITAPYLTGPPSAPGQPPPMIGYRRFACDLMKIAEEQISDQDTKIAMAMRGKATVTPLNQKVAPRR